MSELREPNRRLPLLLLDVMGTVVHDPFFEDLPRALGMTLDELIAVKDPTAWQEFETGALDEAEYLARYLPAELHHRNSDLRRCMVENYRFLDGMQALLDELRAAGYELHLFSNYSPWYRHIEERLGLSRFASWSFVSCETGVRKPDPRAFRLVLERLEAGAGDCLFVDDQEENCRAAAAAGMQVHRFSGHEALRADLRRRGILAR